MTRVDAYRPLCYQCLYGYRGDFCTTGQDCDKCPISDEHGTCECVKEKPVDEFTCPRFKYHHLIG